MNRLVSMDKMSTTADKDQGIQVGVYPAAEPHHHDIAAALEEELLIAAPALDVTGAAANAPKGWRKLKGIIDW